MISFTHSQEQKSWLEAKAQKLNEVFGRNCTVGDGDYYDKRTGKTYKRSQFALTSKDLIPLYEVAYPGGVKTFTPELLEGLGKEHLAVVWADDGCLEKKERIGRLNLYEPEDQCNIVATWIESICGAKGRYEDYEKSGIGRLRFPASEMLKIALAIRDFIHPSLFYKVDMQYKRSTSVAFALTASNPNVKLPLIDEVPELSELTRKEWYGYAESIGLTVPGSRTSKEIRTRIINGLKLVSG